MGETYVGEFETGLRHGKGLLTDQQGHEYEGFWRRGQLQGEAVVTFANGKTFAGNFSDGLAHGLGECSDGETIFKCEYQQGRLLPRVVAKIDEIKIAHDIGENDVARPQTPIFNSSQTQLPVNNDKQTEAVESYLSYEHDFSDQSLHHDDAAISVIRNINEGDFQIIARSGEHWIRLYLPQFSGAGVYQLSGEQASAGRGRDESFSSSDEFPGLLRVRELSEGVLVGQFEFFAYGDGENPAVETQHIRKGHFLIDRGKIQQYEKSFTSDIADVSSPLP